MLHLDLELDNLSKYQLEALSGFILSFTDRFPADEPVTDKLKCSVDVHIPELAAADAEPTPEQAFAVDTAPVPQATATGLDKAGLPWDERIHSSSKNFTADGAWRKKRGVSDALIAEVEGQLRQLMAIPAAPSPFPEVAQASAVPPPPGPTMVPPAPEVDQRESQKSFCHLVGRASKAMGEKKITKEEVQEICVKRGVPSLQLVVNRFDLLPEIAMDIEALIISR